MRQRKVLDDNEWAGWLQWMRNSFRKGTIKETWKRVEQDRWFNPAFQDFVNTEIVGGNLRTYSKIMIIIISSDQLSKTCGFPFKTTFIRFESSLLVCPYLQMIRLPLFSRSRGITYYQTWRQLIISMDTTGLYPLCRF